MNINGAGGTPAVTPVRTAAPAAAAPAAPQAANGPTMGTDQLKLTNKAQPDGQQTEKTDAEKAADAEAQKEGYTDAEEKKTYDAINEKLQLSRIISKIEESMKDDKK